MKKIACAFAALLASTTVALAADFTVTSTDIKAGAKMGNQFVFSSFGCTGANASPNLTWKNAPKDTKSFAVTMYDPDAPTGSGWWHWLAFNIPATATSLPTGAGTADGAALPAGTVQSRTDFGAPGYGGPCPPQGSKPHHYIFTVFALKTETLPMVDANSTAAMVGYFLNANAVAKTSLTAKFNR